MARDLTEMQEAYCLAVADIDSPTYDKPIESAKAAGYAEASVASEAWRLKNNPAIILRVSELKSGQVDKSGLNKSKVLCDLEDNRRKSMASNTEAGRTNARECSKLQGAFLDMWKVADDAPEEQQQLDEKSAKMAKKMAHLILTHPELSEDEVPDDAPVEVEV